MERKAVVYPATPEDYLYNVRLSKTCERYNVCLSKTSERYNQQRHPIDQQLRIDGTPPEVWDLCFGWQARTVMKEEIKRPLELYKGLDRKIPTFPIQSTANQKYRLGYIT
jgi:hypothetical protein